MIAPAWRLELFDESLSTYDIIREQIVFRICHVLSIYTQYAAIRRCRADLGSIGMVCVAAPQDNGGYAVFPDDVDLIPLGHELYS